MVRLRLRLRVRLGLGLGLGFRRSGHGNLRVSGGSAVASTLN